MEVRWSGGDDRLAGWENLSAKIKTAGVPDKNFRLMGAKYRRRNLQLRTSSEQD